MCYETNSMEEVDSHLCDAIPQPAVTKDCDNDPCLSWQVSDWSKVGPQYKTLSTPTKDRNMIMFLRNVYSYCCFLKPAF